MKRHIERAIAVTAIASIPLIWAFPSPQFYYMSGVGLGCALYFHFIKKEAK